MKNYNERVSYEIILTLENNKNNWIIKQPSNSDLEKIHGIYH